MRKRPIAEPLDLWRGVDDAVWREALRPHCLTRPPEVRLPESRPARPRPAEAPPRTVRVPEQV